MKKRRRGEKGPKEGEKERRDGMGRGFEEGSEWEGKRKRKRGVQGAERG